MKTEGAIKNGQSRETGNTKGQSRMDNPEKLATRRAIQRNWQHEGAIKNGQSRETRNTKGNQEWTIQRNWQQTRRGNQEWTIQRNWQHLAHTTQDVDKLHKTTTEKTKKMSKTDTPESGVNTGPHEGYAVPAFQNDHSEFVSTTGYRGLLQDI